MEDRVDIVVDGDEGCPDSMRGERAISTGTIRCRRAVCTADERIDRRRRNAELSVERLCSSAWKRLKAETTGKPGPK